MGEVQLWQCDGLGTDRSALEKVIRIFRSDGVQGIQSQQALENYMEKLSGDSLREMYGIDAEATLQILADCFGAKYAAEKYSEWQNNVLEKKRQYWKAEYETARETAKELKNALAHYKADLYDFYAQAGKVPDYERRQAKNEKE